MVYILESYYHNGLEQIASLLHVLQYKQNRTFTWEVLNE